MSRFIMRAVLAATVAVGCSESTPPAASFATAYHRWSERGPASYSVRMMLQRWCECDAVVDGWVVVTVTDGVVESRRIESTGGVVPENLAHFYPSIDGLFATIADVRSRGYEKVAVRYDPELGYPTGISVDHLLMVIDDMNFTYTVRDLVIR